jgi:putative membrane protein
MVAWDLTAAVVTPVALPAVLYVAGRWRLHRRGVGWPISRDIAFTGGLISIVAALISPIAAADEYFPAHVAQHLLLGMLGPLAIAMAAPITLALRCSPSPLRRVLTAILSSPAVHRLSWAPVGAALSIGLMWPLYLTVLYRLSLAHPLLHDAIHAHMFFSGCLFTFAMIGPDPIRGRGSLSTRLVTLFLAFAGHDILSKYLYVHAADLVTAHPGTGSAASWQLGAQWMWYGGDISELALAVLFLAGWYTATGRELARRRRRAQPQATAS